MVPNYPRVLDFIDRLEKEKAVPDAWDAFLDFTQHYGFSCGALADLPGPAEDLANKVLCVSWPKAWQERYLERDYVRHDPAVLHMSRSFLPYTWNNLLECPDYGKSERNIVFEAGDFHLNAGFIVPLFGLRSGSAILTVAGENTEPSRQELAEIHLAAIYAHAHIRERVRPRRDKRANLTPRERECLRWAAAGKTDWEISEILSISEKTANAHIEQAKRKFDVVTRVQAIMHAVRDGIIQP